MLSLILLFPLYVLLSLKQTYDYYDIQLEVYEHFKSHPIKTWKRITIADIFLSNNNWKRFIEKHWRIMREIEVSEVEKMLNCRKSFLFFKCPNCGETKTIHFNCNSRVCTSCGKKHTDKWAKALSKRVFNVVHRHVIFTMPMQLRPYFFRNPKMLKIYFDCCEIALEKMMKSCRYRDLKPSVVMVMHTFGRAMNFNAHVHCIVAEGGFDKNDNWVNVNYFPYNLLKSKWKSTFLPAVRNALIAEHPEIVSLINELWQIDYKKFYIRARDRIIDPRHLIKYIGRYIRHPAVAETRIDSFDDKTVTFWYEEHGTKNKIWVTMEINEFIMAVISHIPDKHFKLIRYYGGYARKESKKYRNKMKLVIMYSEKQLLITENYEKRKVYCENCNTEMECLGYFPIGPPKEKVMGERIIDWITSENKWWDSILAR